MVRVATSLLNVKEENCIQTIYNLETAHTDYFHIDVMDGKFVQDDTTEKMRRYAEYIKQISTLPIDVHLMVEDVKSFIASYLILEPDSITFHLEAVEKKDKVAQYIKDIKEAGSKVGLSIKPKTKVEELYPYLPYIHRVLIMTVEPGKGGQKLLPETISKIQEIKDYIESYHLDIDIEVDGGINKETAKEVKEAGADILVAGSAIIKEKDFKKAIEDIKK